MGLLDKLFGRTPKRNKDTGTALQRYWKSLCHAIDGIIYCLRYEHNMIIIILATIVAVVAGLLLEINSYEWLFVIVVIGSVAACEMVNSSIEATVDLVTVEKKPLAKIAKDTASSATLIMSIVAFIGAIIIYLPKILELF